MIKMYFYCLFCLCAYSHCDNPPPITGEIKPDTLIQLNKMDIKYHYNPDTLKTPTILETSTIMITDSMTKSGELRILRYESKKYDSVNFMNCSSIERYPTLKFYSFENGILSCDIYY